MRILLASCLVFLAIVPSAFAQQDPAYDPANDPLLQSQGQINLNNTDMAAWFSQTQAEVSSIQNDPAWSPIITTSNTTAAPGAPTDTASTCKNIQVKNIATLADFITCTISRSLIPLVFALGLLFLTWGTTMLVLNAGNEEAREKAKNMMIWGLLVFFVLASVWALVAVLLNTFQLDNKTKAPVPCFQDGTC